MNLRSVFLAVLAGSLLQVAPALAAPPNDNFASAQSLFGTSASVTGTTVEATLEPGEPPHYAGNSSVWYSWTRPRTWCCGSTPVFRVQYGAERRYGSTPAPRSTRSRRSSTSRFAVTVPLGGGTSRRYNVTGGTTYAIAVVEFNRDGAFPLDLYVIPTPANDDFADAQDLGQELDVDVDGTTVGTTTEPGEDNYLGSPDDGELGLVPVDTAQADAGLDRQLRLGGRIDGHRLHRQRARRAGQVDENYGYPEPPPCEFPGYDARGRSEFLGKSGRDLHDPGVHAPLPGAIHLRMREDPLRRQPHPERVGEEGQEGKEGQYTIKVENLGTVPVDPDVWHDHLEAQPDRQAGQGHQVRVARCNQGPCGRSCASHANRARSAAWNPDPARDAKIVAKVKPSQSLSHWVRLDYSHAGEYVYEDSRADEDGKNEAEKPANTVVKRKRKHHR